MDYPHSVPNVNLSGGKFTDGDPGTGLPPSLDPSAWANQVTDSIINVQAAGGLAAAEGDATQLLTGIQNIIAAAVAQHGQCRLALSAPNLKLSEKDGNKLVVAGAQQLIPAGGVFLAPASVAAPVAVSQVTVAANVLTVQTGAAHGRTSGDQAWVSSSNLGVINGTVTVIDATHFTIPFVHANLVATADTGSMGALYYIYCALFSGNVAGAANNGAGLIRLQLPTTAGLVTGNTLNVANILGTVEANGAWPITVVDGTHVDLQGSAFVHAYIGGGTASGLILEAAPIGHVTSAAGIEVKNGDATRTLVGLARTIAGPAFVDSAAQRFVLSYFKRQDKPANNQVASFVSASVTAVEATPSNHAEFMSWSDEPLVPFNMVGLGANSTSASSYQQGIAFDGADTAHLNFMPAAALLQQAGASANSASISNGPYIATLGEGYHFATLVVAVGGSTGTWSQAGASVALRA